MRTQVPQLLGQFLSDVATRAPGTCILGRGGGWRVLGGVPREEGEGRSGGLKMLLGARTGTGRSRVCSMRCPGPSISAWDSRVHRIAQDPWSTQSKSAFCVLAQDSCAAVGNIGCLIPAWVTQAEACGCLVLSPASRATLGRLVLRGCWCHARFNISVPASAEHPTDPLGIGLCYENLHDRGTALNVNVCFFHSW